MVYLIAMVLVAVVSTHAKKFNNPILPNCESPGATKINGTYYVVAVDYNYDDVIIPIHTSTDLKDWKLEGYVFDGNNTPGWARKTKFWSPEIHQIGHNFVVYFAAPNNSITYKIENIGVAVAPHPLGPYSSIDRPIVSVSDQVSTHPSIIKDEGKLYLLWCNIPEGIKARQLNANGLSFYSNETITLLKPTLPWETDVLYYPWHIKRGSYHYIFYNGQYSVGVARSNHVMGPYEKRLEPIMVPTDGLSVPRDVSIVKDWYEEKYLIILNNHGESSDTVLATLDWDADDWPVVGEF